jgi:hypothetical protein
MIKFLKIEIRLDLLMINQLVMIQENLKILDNKLSLNYNSLIGGCQSDDQNQYDLIISNLHPRFLVIVA